MGDNKKVKVSKKSLFELILCKVFVDYIVRLAQLIIASWMLYVIFTNERFELLLLWLVILVLFIYMRRELDFILKSAVVKHAFKNDNPEDYKLLKEQGLIDKMVWEAVITITKQEKEKK